MKESFKTKKSFFSRLFLFYKNHPILVLFVLFGCFLLIPQISHALSLDDVGDGVVSAVKYLIYLFFWLFSVVVEIAASLFLWAIDVNVFTKLMNDGAIYEVWIIVRDFCNIFFILVLLFSAFATIFQLDKYEYKKTIPMLIIMALLVNFSFPIARFVIDLANVPMYFFAQSVFGTGVNDISSGLLSASNVKGILLPNVTNPEVKVTEFGFVQLVSATICMFLFGLSFLVLAVLMLVRMISLTILVMFSPIGFVGMITPALHGFARDWWDKLFKWAFYGPIAVMFVLVAIIVMRAAAKVQEVQKIQNLVGDQGTYNIVSSIAFFAIPIVLFWVAITSAEKYSSEISKMNVNFGSRMGRWVGGKLRRGGITMARVTVKGAASGVDKLTGHRISGNALGLRDAWNNRRGWGGSASREEQERVAAVRAGRIQGGAEGAKAAERAIERKRIQEQVERNKKLGRTDAAIDGDLNKTGDSEQDRILRQAAALTMAERGTLTSSENFEKALAATGDDMESMAKVIRSASKDVMKNAENLTSALNAVNRANINPNAKAHLKSQIIEKADGKALATTGDDYKKMLGSLGGDPNLEGALKAKMKKEGKIKSVFDYETQGKSKEEKVEAYKKLFESGYSAEDLGKQSGLVDDDEFRKYFQSKMQSGKFDASFMQRYLDAIGTTGDRESFKKFVTRATPENDQGGGI